MLTPYQFASNRPLDGIDLDGGEWRSVFDFCKYLISHAMDYTNLVVEYYKPMNGTLENTKTLQWEAKKQTLFVMTVRYLVNPRNEDHLIQIPETKSLEEAANLVFYKYSSTNINYFTNFSIPTDVNSWADLEKGQAIEGSPSDIDLNQTLENMKSAMDLMALGATTYNEFPNMGTTNGTGRMYSKTIASEILSGLPAANRVVATGITGLKFNFSQISKLLTNFGEDDAMILYRGMSGNESKPWPLFLTAEEAYAASYSTKVEKFSISRSGYKRLVNEGIIEELQGVNKTNGAKGKEVKVGNQDIKEIILKQKIE